jgi:hypothetical protein
LKTPLSNYLAVQRGKAVRNHVHKWVGQDEKHDRVMNAKSVVKWMKKDETYDKKIETKIYGEVDEKKVRSNMRVR